MERERESGERSGGVPKEVVATLTKELSCLP